MLNLNFRIQKYVILKNVLHRRTNCWNYIKICSCTTKSIQADIVDKPKHPTSPFAMFWIQMRPSLMEKHPGISNKETLLTSSKLWQQLDAETKSQISKKYKEKYEVYKKNMEEYLNSLSNDQKTEIVRAEIKSAMNIEKKKLKSTLKKMGYPKRPPSPIILFLQSKKVSLRASKEFYEKLKLDWTNLPESERIRYKIQYQELRDKYKKELTAWNNKMTSEGRLELIKSRKTLPPAKENLDFNITDNEMKAMRPKHPVSPILQFSMSLGKDKFRMTKEYFEKLKLDWASLPESERDKYRVQYQENRHKYKKDLTAWKNKMITEGRVDLVLNTEKSVKAKYNTKNNLDFIKSDDIGDLTYTNCKISDKIKTVDEKPAKNNEFKNVNRITTPEFQNISNKENKELTNNNFQRNREQDSDTSSTSECMTKKEIDAKQLNTSRNNTENSKNIISKIKNYFKF